jgi:hypothetical protein
MRFSLTLIALVSTVFSLATSPTAILCGCATNDAVHSFADCYCDDSAIKLSKCLPSTWPLFPNSAVPNPVDQSVLDSCVASTGARKVGSVVLTTTATSVVQTTSTVTSVVQVT